MPNEVEHRPGSKSALDTDNKPALDVAKEYLLEQLPLRIPEDAAMQGFRRNRPGEIVDPLTGERAELYPLFDAIVEDLDSFGLGISLYFRQLILMFFTLIVASIILFASISHNASACRHSETGKNEKNNGLVTGSAAGCFPNDLEIGPNVVPDILVCVVILLTTLVANFVERRSEELIDEGQQTPSDYSIVISNPPDYIDDPDRYRDFFASLFGEENHAAREDVASVTISKDNGEFLQLLARRRALQQDLQDFLAQEQRGDSPRFDDDTLPFLFKLMQPFTYDFGIFKTQGYAKAQLEAVELKLSELIQGGTDNTWRKPRRVHVTFNHEAAQRRALESYQVSALGRWLANYTSWESEYTPKYFDGGTVLSVHKPVEPSELLWENSHIKGFERFQRLVMSVTITMAALALVCFVSIRLRQSWRFTLSIFITCVNAGLPVFIKSLSDMIERHVNFGNREDSMFLKLLLARWVNTALSVYVSYNPRERLSNNALSQVMLILLFDAFLSPLIRVFDPYDWFMRRIVSPLQPTQRAMNRFWVGADWHLAERYTDVSKTIFVGLFYSAALPVAPLVTAAAIVTTFIADRYCILRTWRRVPELSAQLAKRTIGVVAIVVFSHFWASMAFFLNWGAYDELHVSDEEIDDKMERQINCFDGLLECNVENGDLTRAQRFVYRVYRRLGYVAFVAALWKFAGVEVIRALRALFCGSGHYQTQTQLVLFRSLKNVDVYVPVVGDAALDHKLLAAVLIDVPPVFLPVPDNADVRSLCLATPEEIGPLLTPDARGSRDEVDAIIQLLFGVVKFYPPLDSSAVPSASRISTGPPTSN